MEGECSWQHSRVGQPAFHPGHHIGFVLEELGVCVSIRYLDVAQYGVAATHLCGKPTPGTGRSGPKTDAKLLASQSLADEVGEPIESFPCLAIRPRTRPCARRCRRKHAYRSLCPASEP